MEYKCIEDDCRDIVASTDGSAVLYDKENPRTEIIITKKDNYEQWAAKRNNYSQERKNENIKLI